MKFTRLAGVALAASLALAGQAAAQSVTDFDDTAPVSIASATTTQVVAAQPGRTIKVVGGLLVAGGTVNATIVAGFGANCAVGLRSVSGAFPLAAQAGFIFQPLKLRSGEGLCLTTDSTAVLAGYVSYTQR